MAVVPNGENFAATTVGEQRTGIRLWLFPSFIIFEIAAFAMGVVAWLDNFCKATVVTISLIVVLAFLLGLLTIA